MGNRRRQIDMAKSLTPHLGRDYLNPALFTDDSPVLHALVLSAVTFVILGGTEYLGAEQTITLGLEGSIIYCFGFLYLTEGTFPDLFGRGNRYAYGREVQRIFWFLEKTEKIFQNSILLF